MNKSFIIVLLVVLFGMLACSPNIPFLLAPTPTITSTPIPTFTPLPTPTSTPTVGEIRGKVIDPESGVGISTVNVSTEPPSSSITTDTEGNYIIQDVFAGDYTIIATKQGYMKTSANIAVASGKSTVADIHLTKLTDAPNDSQDESIPSDNLIAYYPFNGNARDESGHKHHGVVNGATLVPDRFERPDSAYLFDGVDDYIEISDDDELDLTDQFTIAAWIFQHKQGRKGQRIVDKETAGVGDGFDFDTHGNSPNLNLLRLCGSDCPTANTKYTFNEWHFVAVTVSGTKAYFYLDGRPDGEGDVGRILKNSLNLLIGRAHIGCNGTCGIDNFFDGIIDDVRIYNRTLSDTELLDLYRNGS